MLKGKNTKPNKAQKRKLSKNAPRHIRLGVWLHERKFRMRAIYIAFAALIVFSLFSEIMTVILVNKNYQLTGKARAVIGESDGLYGKLLNFDPKTNAYEYNPGFEPNNSNVRGQSGRPKFSASFNKDPTEGVRVDDPVSKTSLTVKPDFGLAPPKQVDNRLLYPIKGQNAVKVYTMQATGFKEDIILNSKGQDSLSYTYLLDLAPGTEARLEVDGSVSVYGASQELLGEISTGSEADAKLLEKARENAAKTTLLYTIPAPYVREFNSKNTEVKTWFTLDGNKLTVHAANLHNASYPLSIDPSVYIETAAKLMRGNNETNIDFDVNNELIQKGSTTGARFNSLTSTLALQNARWNHGTAVAGGYIYAVGGSNGSSNQSSVYWAKFDPVNYDIDAANPGNGACTNWCTDSNYDLPAGRVGFSLVAYNGFLYAIGGSDSGCTSGNGTGDTGICNTVYIAKLGANGEPSLWHPTDGTPGNWVYWYRAGDLSTEREYSAAVAYNNRMYLLGGRTYSGGATAVNDVEIADILPNGNLGSWTADTDLPNVRYGHSAQVYNDYLYLIGGDSGGTLQSSVEYIKINSDGTLVSSWVTGNPFTTARMSWGGTFSTIWGAYLYISGGCSAVSGSGCSTIASDSQLVSLNADGSVGNWSTVSGVSNGRIGYGFVGWRNTLYTIGGCTAHNTTTGACDTTITTTNYGIINEDGDVSSVVESVDTSTAPCTGGDPYNCDLPTAGDDAGEIGQMLSSTAIMNGYMYVIGGCADNSTSTECNANDAMSSNVAYAAISSDGTLHRSPSCVGTYSGSWCVDSSHTVNSTDGVGAAGVTVFEGRIYVIGGLDNTTDGSTNIYSIRVNSDGSLDTGGWNQQTFSNLGITGELAYTFAYARANPSSAATYPGNLYIFGGCGAIDTGVECDSNYRSEVYKCNIETNGLLEEDDANDCDTTNQLQIDTEAGGGNQGLGLHSGAVYANYIYLVGGYSANVSNRDTVFYAKFDNSNNVVAASGSAWVESSNSLTSGRGWGTSFGYNGHLYVVGGYDSSGGGSLIGSIEFAKFNVGTGDIEAFQTSTVTLDNRWGQSLIVSNSYAYMIGGCDAGSAPDGCTSFEPSLQVFQIYNNDSGTPGGYTSSGNLFATARFGAGAAVYNGFMYIAGGCIDTEDCFDATNSVQYAALNDDGTIGTWSATTDSLPADRVFGQLEVAGGTLYFLGGQDDSGTAQSDIYYAAPDSNGNIPASTWATATGGIGEVSGGVEEDRTQFGATIWNDRIYVSGGYDGSAVSNEVFVSPDLSSGGDISANSWTSTTAFNVARRHHTAIAYANNLYILAGYSGSAVLNDVQFTQINSDGSLDSWTYTTSLPVRIRGSDGFAANGYMYLFGGKKEDNKCTNDTYVAPIAANTTVASGNNPTGIGEWFVTNERFNGERANASAVYTAGKAFVLGGACGELEAGTQTQVLEDDFDATYDAGDWSTVTRFAANTDCGTLSSGNAFVSLGRNGSTIPEIATVNVDVSYGGTVSFYLRIPTSGTTCDPPEADEDVQLQYSINSGTTWSTIATYDESNFDTPTLIQENIPDAAFSANTRFRWIIPNQSGNGQDEFAIDDLVIMANDVPPVNQVLFDDFDPTLDALDWISTTGMNNNTTCGTISSGNNLNSSGGTSSAISTDLDMRYGGTVSFWLRIPTNDGGGCSQPDASDEDLLLQYSTDSGSNWNTFVTYQEDGGYNTPVQVSAVIPQAAWSSAVRFRWIMPNADAADDMWAIDDVDINAFQLPLTYVTTHRVAYTTLLSQPQVAKYSRMIDTDTDVFPTYWLLNGIDNSVGARWLMRYRTMHDISDGAGQQNPNEDCGTSATMPVMTTWGQDTNFGEVDLGTPEAYIPLNSSGGNINCARYFFFYVTIDSSQAFGYPEDVTRGPTITDLTLFFTADPSKRLRHGKTFTGGELQPLDTPF